LATLAAEARTALVDRDAQRIRASARSLHEAAPGECLAIATSAALLLAGAVIEAAPSQAAPMEKGS